MTDSESLGAREDLPDWFKSVNCAHEFGLDPEVFVKKPIFWRDRMMLVVEAKAEAKAKLRKMYDDLEDSKTGIFGD